MTKFHINRHGVPSRCTAKEGNCPLGNSDQHFKTKKDAQDYADKRFAEEYGVVVKDSEYTSEDYVNKEVKELESTHLIKEMLENHPEKKILDYVNIALGEEGMKEYLDNFAEERDWDRFIVDEDTVHENLYRFEKILGTETSLRLKRDYFGETKFLEMLKNVDKELTNEGRPGLPLVAERVEKFTDVFNNELTAQIMSNYISEDDLDEFNYNNAKKYNFVEQIDFDHHPKDVFMDVVTELENLDYGLSIKCLRDFTTEEQFEKILTNAEDHVAQTSSLRHLVDNPRYKIKEAFEEHPERQVLDYFVNAVGEDNLEKYVEYAKENLKIEDNFNNTDQTYLKFSKISQQFTPETMLHSMKDFLGREKFLDTLKSAVDYLDNEVDYETDIIDEEYNY